MERTDELKERIRQQPLNDRLEESRRRIGDMCSKGRCPKMTIPVQHDDDDFYINTTLADAQATIAELMEALECVLTEKPLPNGEYVHLVSCNGDRRKPAGTVGVSCSCRVGRATIAALQARVQELQCVADEKCRCFLERAEQAEQQLTQRTAELEVAKGKLDIILRVSRGEPDDELAVDYGGLGLENDPAVLGVYDLIAELRHVKGERDSAKKMEAVQKEVADNQTWHVQKLRTLILALPKVDGEIEIYTGKNTNQVVVTYKRGVIIGTLYGLDHAKPVAALYKHRQRMEG